MFLGVCLLHFTYEINLGILGDVTMSTSGPLRSSLPSIIGDCFIVPCSKGLGFHHIKEQLFLGSYGLTI